MKPITFTVDNLTLTGDLFLPDPSLQEQDRPPLVVGSHGLEGSRLSAKQQVLSRLLPASGIAFFRFDHRGCGDSQGDFVSDTSLEKRTRDFMAAVTTVMDTGLTSRDLGVFGSSMGGATCINAWERIREMDVTLLGGVLCAAPVKSRTIENIPTAANGNRPALPLSFFAENLLFNLTGQTRHLHHILIFHGDADEVVPVANARTIYKNMKEPKKLILHRGGNHQMSEPDHQAEFEREAVDWFNGLFGTMHD